MVTREKTGRCICQELQIQTFPDFFFVNVNIVHHRVFSFSPNHSNWPWLGGGACQSPGMCRTGLELGRASECLWPGFKLQTQTHCVITVLNSITLMLWLWSVKKQWTEFQPHSHVIPRTVDMERVQSGNPAQILTLTSPTCPGCVMSAHNCWPYKEVRHVPCLSNELRSETAHRSTRNPLQAANAGLAFMAWHSPLVKCPLLSYTPSNEFHFGVR